MMFGSRSNSIFHQSLDSSGLFLRPLGNLKRLYLARFQQTPTGYGILSSSPFSGVHKVSIRSPRMSHFVHIGYITVKWPRNKKPS